MNRTVVAIAIIAGVLVIGLGCASLPKDSVAFVGDSPIRVFGTRLKAPKENDFRKRILGLWKIYYAFEIDLNGRCSNLSLTFRDDGRVISESGENVTEERYILTETTKDKYLLEKEFVSSNSKPNCQGLSHEFVRDHQASAMYIDIFQERLRIFHPLALEVPLFILTRVDD